MTDEEKAEEHAKRYKIDLCAYCRECEEGSCSHTDDAVFGYKDGYKAGLKSGRPKWHKVAAGDYPPCEKGYDTINVLTDCGDIAYYDYDAGCWIAEPSSVEIDPPIAWCEIPKYEG